MDPGVQHVVGLLLRSRLLTADEAKALYQRWRAETKHGRRDGKRFTKWLVANGSVTEYQAALLARGHTEGFFLGAYKILERLGRGRMAGVYKAVHHGGQVVAVKVLPPSKAKDPALLARFQREARLAVRLHHPHVVRALEVGVEGDHHYLVLEYLEGETLEEVLKQRGRLAPSEAVRLVQQALLGLHHLHEQGLVHRDLKPGNLMLVPAAAGEDPVRSGTVKILDIGLGRELVLEASAAPVEDGQLTGVGVVLGTPDYLAPEQARDARTADIRADLYSLGCVLYHAVAGQPPFPDTNLINQMVRHATEPPRPLQEFTSAVPEGLQAIVNRLLAKDPAQRYATPAQAAQALQSMLDAQDAARSTSVADTAPWTAVPGVEPAVAESVTLSGTPEHPPAEEPAESRTQPQAKSPVPAPTAPRSGKPARRGRAAEPAGSLSLERPAAEGAVDVELIAVVPTSGSGWQLNRRDLLMLALGGGSVLFAVFLGWMLAQIFRKREPVPSTPKRPELDSEKDS
ncbi:MAG: protein kinase [Gemmataceae bacterium]|nr:protein kinase [Gemmataceae bacterium]